MIAIKQPHIPQIAADVMHGLTQRPKSLPPKLFYDAAGSELFEEITRLPEYYLTRTETAILEENAREIAEFAGHGVTVVELGAGTATKTRILLRAFSRRQLVVDYVPVDVSSAALEQARTMLADLSAVRVSPLVSELSELGFMHSLRRPRLVMFIGSSIGNFETEAAVDLFRRIRSQLEASDHVLIGTDLVKPPEVLIPAYDDAAGVTARFNKNVLARINRELGGQFDLDAFEHVACWDPKASRMEMYLESTRAQAVRIDLLGRTFEFAKGELVHTENSYKYTIEGVCRMLEIAGFETVKTWQDAQKWFAVHLARPR